MTDYAAQIDNLMAIIWLLSAGLVIASAVILAQPVPDERKKAEVICPLHKVARSKCSPESHEGD